ncbi:MAG: hypothetical protein OXT09_31530 [Myxococcales bacterium]|nr:hypothetical protein [Myxococcales bacterium]
MWQQGYVQLFRFRSIPVRMHWSVAIGMLWVSGPRIVPGAWLGLLLVILLHEAGHAFLARRYGLRVHSIEMDALGGLCVFETPSVPHHSHVIAWGGVLAQMLLLIATYALSSLGYWPQDAFFASMQHVFTTTNLLIIILNLLPFPPLDGSQAWKVFKRRPRLVRHEPPPKKGPREITQEDLEQVDRTLEQVFRDAKKKD